MQYLSNPCFYAHVASYQELAAGSSPAVFLAARQLVWPEAQPTCPPSPHTLAFLLFLLVSQLGTTFCSLLLRVAFSLEFLSISNT